ncbi:ribosome biogenesis GTP-binding protein YihA/YsxC [Christensenellaceae bacterium OttesenSCG-928-L17]|nr:ribosome biogenesis GTP-binding protein YihA/YsxC [Christensenellaceae bacterium OttesenSCG-928-L17]
MENRDTINAAPAELFRVKQAEFVTSVGANTPAYPEERVAEIAIVGKSNVGKSSLINSLCNNYKLAKTSSSPGKTRLINYFLINREFYIVDLPGYGFAKASKTEQQAWGALMENYLSSGRVTHLLLLLDIRHSPTAEDRQMFQWMIYYGVPFTLIATKADKLSRSKRQQAANAAAKALGAPPAALPYSTEEGKGREALQKRIGDIVADAKAAQGS